VPVHSAWPLLPGTFKVVLAGPASPQLLGAPGSLFRFVPKEGLPLPCNCASPFYLAAIAAPKALKKVTALLDDFTCTHPAAIAL
jgi:hypothetical protein